MGCPGCLKAGERLVLRQILPWLRGPGSLSLPQLREDPFAFSEETSHTEPCVKHSWSSCPLSQESHREPVMKVTVGGHVTPA